MDEPQTGKATVVAIGGRPCAAALERQRGEVRVGNEVPARADRKRHLPEELPVPSAGRDRNCVRLPAQSVAEGERLIERCRVNKDARVRDDANEAAEHELRATERLEPFDEGLEPGAILLVIGGVLAMGVDEDVDIAEDQPSRSMSSISAALSSRSTPGCSPPLP